MTFPRLFASSLFAVAGVAACGNDGGGAAPPASPSLTRAQLMDPKTCQGCHAEHFREWSGSMHAYAAEDPVFLAMNARGQRETNGALGTFCVKCHAPLAVREGATTDGLNLASLEASLKGVTCFFCHTIDAVEGTHDAAVRTAGETMRGPLRDPVSNTAHRAAYARHFDREQAESSAMCGACHDVVTPHGVLLERTYIEWQASVFAHPPAGLTCNQCHMAESQALEPIAQVASAPPRRRHAHTFAGVDTALTPFPERAAQQAEVDASLGATLQSALCVTNNGLSPQIRVVLDNVGAGHSFPSGASQDRRLWVEVVGYAGGDVVYSSGVVPDGAAVTKSADPDLWLLRDCIFDDAGAEKHMFWEAASYEGNALPALLTFDQTDPRFYQTHIVQPYPRATGSFIKAPVDRVTMRVRLQPIGRDVLDDLVASGDLDPAVRDAMPTRDVGEALEWTAASAKEKYFDEGLPLTCVTKTNLNLQTDRVRAPTRARCTP